MCSGGRGGSARGGHVRRPKFRAGLGLQTGGPSPVLLVLVGVGGVCGIDGNSLWPVTILRAPSLRCGV